MPCIYPIPQQYYIVKSRLDATSVSRLTVIVPFCVTKQRCVLNVYSSLYRRNQRHLIYSTFYSPHSHFYTVILYTRGPPIPCHFYLYICILYLFSTFTFVISFLSLLILYLLYHFVIFFPKPHMLKSAICKLYIIYLYIAINGLGPLSRLMHKHKFSCLLINRSK